VKSDFVDSNVFVHAMVAGPLSEPALGVIAAGPITSVQALNETVWVLRRKHRVTMERAIKISEHFRSLCSRVCDLTLDDHIRALDLASRHKFAWWDALLLTVAIRARAERFLSEDLQHGRIVDGSIEIVNPFR